MASATDKLILSRHNSVQRFQKLKHLTQTAMISSTATHFILDISQPYINFEGTKLQLQ